MSLRDHCVDGDDFFELDENSLICGLAFPCRECVHAKKQDDDEPCCDCSHNSNSLADANRERK
jgi:hypothetical protein